VDVFVLIEDETLRADSLRLVQQLREAGRVVEYPLTVTKGDKQFKRAMELGTARTMRLERGEAGEVQVRVKDLKTREERLVALGELFGSSFANPLPAQIV
jgi:histidyl-tRNA synthetase